MRSTLFLALLLASAGSTQVFAQQPALSLEATFDTASIRPAHLTPGCFSMLPPGGTQFALTCITLRNLVEMAFKTTYLDGGGSALESLYDLRATSPNEQPWTWDTVRPMLRHLLIQRFALATHPGKRELSGYGMVVAKGGLKMHSTAPASVVEGQKAGETSQNFLYPGHVQGRGLDIGGIVGLLSAVLHAPVADHTAIAGIFNLDLSYAPDTNTANPDSTLPSFFTAVEEQLGIKLRPEKVIVDTLVIDHVDTAPTPN